MKWRVLYHRVFYLTIACALSVLSSAICLAQEVSVKFVTKTRGFGEDRTLRAGIHFKIEKGWHLYWKYPGDSGTAPKVKWDLPVAVSAGALQWPYPERIPVGPLVNFGYETELLLIADLRAENGAPKDPFPLRAEIDWLVCKEDCYPGEAAVSLEIPADATPEIFSRFEEMLPAEHPDFRSASAVLADGTAEITFPKPAGFAAGSELFFFPGSPGLIENAAEQKLRLTAGGLALSLKRPLNRLTENPNFSGILVNPSGWLPWSPKKAIAINTSGPPPAAAAAAGGSDFIIQIVFALLGGLLLNIMPCVFPVLSLKVLHFVELSGEEKRHVRLHGLIFTAGVVCSFVLLAAGLIALKQIGQEIGWGFQLQSPAFVASMCLLLTAVALNLLDVFDVGASIQRAAGRALPARGYAGSFLDGVLAVLLASPCSAPFMGAAVAYALTASAAGTLVIFASLGLGMAAPFLAISFSPALTRCLPRPGAWMETFRRFCAFPVFATVAWLAWVYVKLTSDDALLVFLLALTGASLGLFLYGSAQKARSPKRRRAGIVTGCAVVLLSAVCLLGGNPPAGPNEPAPDGWTAYSQARFEDLSRAGRPIFIDFTAAWCITCQVNKKLVLNTPEIMSAFKSHGIELMRADWTRQDREITAALASYGYRSVPLYVLRIPGRDPKIFPSILTKSMIFEALK